MKKLYIYGCGGVGNELAEHLTGDERYNLAGFIDDNPEIRECMGYQSRTLDETLSVMTPDEFEVIISIGEPAVRKVVSDKLAAHGIPEKTVDIASHFNSEYADVGEGCVLHHGAYISVNTRIGRCSMINKEVIVGHDSDVGEYVVLCPRVTLGGDVTIGDNTFVGTGAIIRNGISIGKNVIIGMGSVVVKDVEDDAVVVGNPARFVRKNESHRVFRKK